MEAEIDKDLIEGIAASAFRTNGSDVDEVLVDHFPDYAPAFIRNEIEEMRAAADFGLGAVPAPAARLGAIREQLKKQVLDGFLIPLADEHQGEFIAKKSQRLAWLTGFSGSAGLAIVLTDEAAIFVDGRYTLQVREQVDLGAFTPVHIAEMTPERWLEEHVFSGSRIGFDPWLHTSASIARLREVSTSAGAELVPVDPNPLDIVWHDQPPAPLGPVQLQVERNSGAISVLKRQEFAEGLETARCDASILSAPDSIAWLLNIRGSDVPNTPLALSYAIVSNTGNVDWFIDDRKLGVSVLAALDNGISVKAPADFANALAQLAKSGSTIRLDPASAPEWIRLRLEEAGGALSAGIDLCELPKARKNSVEIAGSRNAHIRDGAALTTFLAWLSNTAPLGGITEISAADKLLECRTSDRKFRGLSFETISGSGPNGAIVHYRVTPKTNRHIRPRDMYLVDSGAQYVDGTTDVTRTIFVDDGNGVPKEESERFTRVLKGHIAVAQARFPAGTRGSQIDALARLSLWDAGLDYDHGTGHGVGSYLGVHEGPQRIAKQAGGVPLESGMILSNEPGYYKEGAYGIRIENLVVVIADDDNDTERPMMAFETITLAPIDRHLINLGLLTMGEREWLNAYHARVRNSLSSLVDDVTRAWLFEATAPL
jgi:Xaa-Pro aminopeptidase